MKMNIFKKAAMFCSIGLVAASCNKNLNVKPIVGTNPSNVYDNVADIQAVLAKLYGGMTLSGSSASACDLGNYDAGTSVLFRMFWCEQELPTDEVKIAWNDGNLPDLNTITWNANNDKIHLLYDRTFYQISVCNEFLRNLPASKVNSFGSDASNVKSYVAEARFLRAMAYWIAIDAFGDIPFATETSSVGTTPPQKATRAQVFNYITSELNAIDADLIAPGSSYGRADKGAEWTLLAKLYLNAKVYTGTPKYDSAVLMCQKIIQQGGYSLASKYANLFRTDNKTTSKSEIIFPLQCNGLTSQSYGNSTFLINAQVGGSMPVGDFGISSGWAGYRATKNLVALFPNALTTSDQRSTFDTAGQTLEMTAVLNYPNGYSVAKFANVSSTGAPGSGAEFTDLDIPFFRLADVYLMYAEASLQNNGDQGTAKQYVNLVRERAGAPDMVTVTTDSVLAERGRELFCEGTRRTDLIRFGYFTGGAYLWPWKGGTLEGTSVDAHFNVYAIPTADLSSNPNLIQNAGY